MVRTGFGSGSARSGAGRAALGAALVAGLLAAALPGEADAACTRRVVNRSPYTLFARQEGGSAFVVPSGRTRSVVLAQPGRMSFEAYCPGAAPGAGSPVVADSFRYEVDGPACSYSWGIYTSQFSRAGFVPDPEPFVLNNPKLGDVVLGPTGPACPSISVRY